MTWLAQEVPAADTPPARRIHVRWMIVRDLPEVLAIEAASFVDPWQEADFRRVLAERDCIGMIAEMVLPHAEPVVGYVVYRLSREKFHLLNFAVCPTRRRAGVGRKMIGKLATKLNETIATRTRITLEVRESNLAAQLFLRSQGFLATASLRGYFEDVGEDGIRMTLARATH